MINFQQLFLTILISTLTVLIIIFSVYVFRILSELRQTLAKMNKILDDMGTISGSIAKPVAGLSDLVMGLKSGVKVFEAISRFAGKNKDEDEETDEEEKKDD